METLKKVYFTASKVEDQVYKVCKALGALAMSIAFLAIFLQVIYRYILCNFMNLPLAFTEELARYCLFWIIYLLLPVSIKDGMEAANTYLPGKLKGAAKTALYLLVRGLCLVIALIAFIYSFSALQTYWNFTSPVMQLPGFFQYGPVVIGMGIVIIRYIIEMMGFACGEIKPFESVGQGGVE